MCKEIEKILLESTHKTTVKIGDCEKKSVNKILL